MEAVFREQWSIYSLARLELLETRMIDDGGGQRYSKSSVRNAILCIRLLEIVLGLVDRARRLALGGLERKHATVSPC